MREWDASGYDFVATENSSEWAFSLTLALTRHELGREAFTQPIDGGVRSEAWAWGGHEQYDRTITGRTSKATGDLAGTDVASGGWQGYQSGGTAEDTSHSDGETGIDSEGTLTTHFDGTQWFAYGFSTAGSRPQGGPATWAGTSRETSGIAAMESYAGAESYSGDASDERRTSPKTLLTLGRASGRRAALLR